ncbi:hypothetical protein GEMRC1_012043 [Eukaryota sp. GEM-RC1]
MPNTPNLTIFKRSRIDPHPQSHIPNVFLPTIRYSVQKRNHYYFIQNRILLLNSSGWSNIKVTKTGQHSVTKTFKYSNIELLTLTSWNVIIIEVDCDHSFTYISPEAIQIAVELVHRLDTIRSIYSLSRIPPSFQPPPPSPRRICSPMRFLASPSPRKPSPSKISPALLKQYQQKSDEFLLYLIFKHAGLLRMVNEFVQRIPTILNSLFKYSPELVRKSKQSREEWEKFMSGLRELIVHDFRYLLIDSVFDKNFQDSPDLFPVISRLVDISLQKIILTPVSEDLFFYFRSFSSNLVDNQIQEAYSFISDWDLQSFDSSIAEKITAKSLITVLSNLTSLSNPTSYLPHWFVDTITDCCRIINRIALQSSDDFLSADEFLPLLIYCIKETKLESPFSICQMIYEFSDSELLKGEEGYYLASFNSACLYLQQLCNDCSLIGLP